MHNLLKFKSKAHSLINYAFYALFFVSGFILGKIGTLENIKELLRKYFESRF